MSRHTGTAARANDDATEAPELWLPALARAAADRRRARKEPLTRSEALAEAPWDDSMPAGWQRQFRAAYADRLLERGLALPSSEGRSGPSGPSGEHRGIRVALRAKDEAQLARWRAKAKRAGLDLNAWLRQLADGAP